jgi:hypothetical protein
LWVLVCAGVTVLVLATTAYADARTDFLVNALRTSPMFRVRAQAAMSLGSVRAEPQVIAALTSALEDEHPAVRAAAAAALERQGDPSVLPALRRSADDREAAVRTAVTRAIAALERVQSNARATTPSTSPGTETADASSGRARYYVAVGRPGTNIRTVSPATLDGLRTFIAQQARSIPGVELAPEGERRADANRVLRSRGLVGYFLDSSILELEERPGGGVRARVSVVVQTYPDRNIRSMLSGSATVTSGAGETARRQAIEGALRGALRGLAAVMNAGATVQASVRRP